MNISHIVTQRLMNKKHQTGDLYVTFHNSAIFVLLSVINKQQINILLRDLIDNKLKNIPIALISSDIKINE